MGTITKRTGTHGVSYQAKVRRAGHPTLSKSFPDRRTAELWIAQQELAVARGALPDAAVASTTTMAVLMQCYLWEVTPTKKGAVQEAYHMRPLMESKLAAYTPTTLTADAVRQWRDERLRTAAPATVNRQLNLLHHVIEHSRKEWGIGAGNVVSDVSRPKNARGRDRRLSYEEEVRLLAACTASLSTYLSGVVRLAIETGMRQAELVGLRWELIDLDRAVARLLDTKNGESRTVPLSQTALAVLRGRRDAGQVSGPVWPGVTPEAVKRAFLKACARAEVSGLRFHDLRHEATSRFFEKGLNVMEAASITGHKDLRMLKRYTHLDASKLALKLG
ncbi:MAG: site-specific integrase [Variovorax paradoxus]|uniref:Site-specific integrase n=1 Tax=Variovorax paradoxus TaxID=34073 RepID=A0A2W5SQ82_VARPD|nr:MAG: site-specific integrase [Variovorax paradoxus]